LGRVQVFKGSRVQAFKGSRVQGFKGSRVQGFKGSKGSKLHQFSSSMLLVPAAQPLLNP
jgi:hypothetical protein